VDGVGPTISTIEVTVGLLLMVVVKTDVVVFTPGTSASMYVVCKCGIFTRT
jgi:hypothetical protein